MSFGPKGRGTDVMVLGSSVNWDTYVVYRKKEKIIS